MLFQEISTKARISRKISKQPINTSKNNNLFTLGYFINIPVFSGFLFGISIKELNKYNGLFLSLKFF